MGGDGGGIGFTGVKREREGEAAPFGEDECRVATRERRKNHATPRSFVFPVDQRGTRRGLENPGVSQALLFTVSEFLSPPGFSPADPG